MLNWVTEHCTTTIGWKCGARVNSKVILKCVPQRWALPQRPVAKPVSAPSTGGAVSPCSPRRRWPRSGIPRTCPGTRSRACRPGEEAAARGGWGPAPPSCCSESRWLGRECGGYKSTLLLWYVGKYYIPVHAFTLLC